MSLNVFEKLLRLIFMAYIRVLLISSWLFFLVLGSSLSTGSTLTMETAMRISSSRPRSTKPKGD